MRKVLFILSQLRDPDIDWLIENGTKEAASPGDVLIEEGKPIEVLFILLDGQLEVSIAAMPDQPLATLHSGEILGELSFLDSRPPTATVVAVEESTVLSVPRDRLQTKLAEDDGFAARFYLALGTFVASRLRRTTQRMGYGEGRAPAQADELGEALDPGLVEKLALAGARFDWMLKRLRDAPVRGTTEV